MVSQSVRYVHSCLQLAVLIIISMNILIVKSVIIECFAKPTPGSRGLMWQKIQEPLTKEEED